MKLTPISKVLKEDLKDAPKWIDVILTALNTLIQDIYNLDKSLEMALYNTNQTLTIK